MGPKSVYLLKDSTVSKRVAAGASTTATPVRKAQNLRHLACELPHASHVVNTGEI